jgi:hypothetical protein
MHINPCLMAALDKKTGQDLGDAGSGLSQLICLPRIDEVKINWLTHVDTRDI